MPVGRKIYYELDTGDVILITEEKPGINATNTTKEQDFQIYPVLAARNPDTVGVIQLQYGQYRAEFQSARAVKVTEDNQILFQYPEMIPPVTVQLETLKQKNAQLEQEKTVLQENIALLEGTIMELTTIIASLQGGSAT